MISGRYREEVFNVLLALLLHRRGVVSAPEQALRESLGRRRHIPDVMVTFRGLRTVIEGKVDDQADGDTIVLEQARDRVAKGVAHIGVAVLYPASLRGADFPDLQDLLGKTTLRITVCSEAGDVGWVEGNLDYLADMLRRTFEQLVAEDVVAKVAKDLDTAVSTFAKRVFVTSATSERAAKILGIGAPPERGKARASDEEEDQE